jgi:DNA-binding MarR family transcriptional regulator
MSIRAEEKLNDRVEAILRAFHSLDNEMTLPVLMTLFTVMRHPGISINDLAEKIAIPQQTASRYVAILLGRYAMPGDNNRHSVSLLSLEVSQEDPRKRALYLTNAGKSKLTTILKQLYD